MLSVEALQANVTEDAVALVAWRFTGCEGGCRSRFAACAAPVREAAAQRTSATLPTRRRRRVDLRAFMCRSSTVACCRSPGLGGHVREALRALSATAAVRRDTRTGER